MEAEDNYWLAYRNYDRRRMVGAENLVNKIIFQTQSPVDKAESLGPGVSTGLFS
jgi:hypothetical protein